MKILLTGFEPFGGSSINPSEQVIRKLDRKSIDQVIISTEILPVDRARGPEKLIQVLSNSSLNAVLCLGEASGRAAISIERVAINLLDFRIADNSGSQVVDEPIISDGPVAYMTTLPVRTISQSLQDVGIPVEISLSAGSFLCNQVFYTLMHILTQQGRMIPAGFIHLPALPEQAARQGKSIPTMSLDLTVFAVETVIRCINQTIQTP